MGNTTTQLENDKVPEEFRDCNRLITINGLDCRALTEMFCVRKGKCKFYKSKESDRN